MRQHIEREIDAEIFRLRNRINRLLAVNEPEQANTLFDEIRTLEMQKQNLRKVGGKQV